MNLAAKRRAHSRAILLDRSLEELPLFRLSDTSDEASITYNTSDGGRWRVLASPGDRLPGTFDQDVYVELMRRYHEAGEPSDGGVSFTLHAFLRSMGRQVDGRTYEQLRSSLSRLERTMLQSERSYFDAAASDMTDVNFALLASSRMLTPRMAALLVLNFGRLSRKEQASFVQPGVSSFG